MIERMPANTTIEDVMEKLHFKAEIDAALKELDEGKGIPHEEVKKRVNKWFSK